MPFKGRNLFNLSKGLLCIVFAEGHIVGQPPSVLKEFFYRSSQQYSHDISGLSVKGHGIYKISCCVRGVTKTQILGPWAKQKTQVWLSVENTVQQASLMDGEGFNLAFVDSVFYRVVL